MDLNNIIKYLKDEETHIEVIKKLNLHETENISLINKFQDIFDDYIIRYGVIQNDNLSFLYSILFSLDEDFKIFEIEEQTKYINVLKNKVYEEVTEKNLLKKLNLVKNGWNKKNVLELLKIGQINNNYIYYISSYFHINLFVFDYHDDKIYPYYNEDKFNKYKLNILIFKYNNRYEPLIYLDNTKIFGHNSDILNKILNSKKMSIPKVGFTKKIFVKSFEINDSINLVNNEQYNEPDKFTNTTSDDYNNDNNVNNKYDNGVEEAYTLDLLLKKNKPELVSICKNMKIPYSNKNKKKLAEDILDKEKNN